MFSQPFTKRNDCRDFTRREVKKIESVFIHVKQLRVVMNLIRLLRLNIYTAAKETRQFVTFKLTENKIC